MTDETTTEQLAEIEGQAADTPATEYTPPDGWRVVRFGEQLLPGDVWVNEDGTERQSAILHWDAAAVSGGRCIRRIKPQPQPQPVQVREGRWRKRSGVEVSVSAMPTDHDDFTEAFPWWDGHETTWTQSGHLLSSGECPADLVEYLGPIEPEPQPEPNTAAIEELRSEVSYVQRLLGESRQRVTELEKLVVSLRTINRGCENAVRDAGKENTDLKHRLETIAAEWHLQAGEISGLQTQLAAVKAELVTQAETSRRLRIELDAAQQVPPAIVDRFQEGWNQGTARAVETVLEWLEPIRLVDSAYLANATMQHLPQIMRHLTGLDSND